MLDRGFYRQKIETGLRRSPVVAVLGPRQCGKTTLAREIATEWKEQSGAKNDRESTGGAVYLDLESPGDLVALENPELFLSAQRGLVVLDEVQERPDLFPLLRVLADRPDAPAKFLLLGSASPALVAGASESLAGRVEFVELRPFQFRETGADSLDLLWERGGFPRSFLADSEADAFAWRDNFIQTYLQRDIAAHIPGKTAVELRRFWMMLANFHGQIFNASELGRAFGVSSMTARKYVDVLEGTYMVRVLQPWYENIGKRLVKSPKIYLRDSGLFHTLLGLATRDALWSNPKVGASWEGFALEQTLGVLEPQEAYFWALHSGAELDLFCVLNGRRIGVEFKWRERPATSKSMHAALEDLRLEHLWVVYPGKRTVPLTEKITALPLAEVGAILKV
ncbi:putative AAA+ superfamily ATPase [Ereboglobus sp. PH5-10]|uniref:ATP-binding protein n=1 Tax=Ereboglobus sp. PH5-10 TaxID=2940629 RepID=UPI0024051690|nr:ATP-binding protein [Ereboglobus sp. PH5-10]MDF9828293.1 putative AAA+ superfamily ATPase [Ereboglobus sp. PH5-10]